MKTLHKKGRVFDIKRFAMHDGLGIRTTVFLKGCSWKCIWCQNPEGITLQRQLLYIKNKCINCKICVNNAKHGGVSVNNQMIVFNRNVKEDWDRLVYLCPSNALQFDSEEYTIEALLWEIEKDQIFYKENGGVTFSGGEPFQQYTFLYEALKACKAKKLHTAIETTLSTTKEQMIAILPYVDQMYVDLKLMQDEDHQRLIGASNKQTLDNLEYILTSPYKDAVIVRTPLIPEITANKENIEAIANFLVKLYPNVAYELLNYNPLAKAKYGYINKSYFVNEDLQKFSKAQMQNFYKLAKALGLRNVVEN
ncbi:MAG: glycyl-radical enzyme activating protein [Breznakia sp.]